MVLRLVACRSVNCAKRRGLEPYRYRRIDNLGVVFYGRANSSVTSNSWALKWWRPSRCAVILDPRSFEFILGWREAREDFLRTDAELS